jgi:GAF domain-containing protein
MVEPLNPDTLARLQAWIDGDEVDVDIDHAILADLLAVARDHARLTAENEALTALLREGLGYIDQHVAYLGRLLKNLAALSAEAGDTDG